MVFHFFQGGGIVVLLDEGLDEIERLLLSLGEHDEFRFIFDHTILAGRVNKRFARKSSLPQGPAVEQAEPEIRFFNISAGFARRPQSPQRNAP